MNKLFSSCQLQYYAERSPKSNMIGMLTGYACYMYPIRVPSKSNLKYTSKSWVAYFVSLLLQR